MCLHLRMCAFVSVCECIREHAYIFLCVSRGVFVMECRYVRLYKHVPEYIYVVDSDRLPPPHYSSLHTRQSRIRLPRSLLGLSGEHPPGMDRALLSSCLLCVRPRMSRPTCYGYGLP